MMYEAIISDCDGVLVDSEAITHVILQEELAQVTDINIDPNEILAVQGQTCRAVILHLSKKYGFDITEDQIKHMIEKVHAAFTHNLPTIDGVHEAFLKLDLKIAVASNSKVSHIQRAVDLNGLTAKVGANIVSFSMVAHPKPAPDVYLKAAQMLNVAPEKCLVIEDSVAGASAGIKAGMTVIGFLGASHLPEGHAEKLVQAGVSYTIKHMSELENAILELNEIAKLS
ncbi:phosphatase [Gammaproteobacteria bacterium]|nr:phosphatase [Gammaproteobacteria bacterium]